MTTMDNPPLKVTIVSDYICPFCYVGHARVRALRARYALSVDWWYLEIHPDNPPQGMPLEALGYPPAQWARMMENLQAMAREENLPLAHRTFTTNSHDALLLAERAKGVGEEVFESLHERLFEAYFVEQRNIGDRDVLRGIAQQAGLENGDVDAAWTDPRLEQRLRRYRDAAVRMGLGGVPAVVIGGRLFSGVVPRQVLEDAARAAVEAGTADRGLVLPD